MCEMLLVMYVGHLQEHTTLLKLNLISKRLLGMHNCDLVRIVEYYLQRGFPSSSSWFLNCLKLLKTLRGSPSSGWLDVSIRTS